MKIYFHIGFPRSATTYMQKNYFSDNKEINFIGRKLNYGIEDNNFYDLLKKIMKYSDKEFLYNKKKLLFQFKKIKLSKKKINLISEEGILCQNYWNNNDVYRTLKRLIYLLNVLKIDCNFIITIRNQLDCVQSVYRYFYASYFKKNFKNLDNFLDTKNSKSKKILFSFNYFQLFKFLKNKNKKFLFLLFEDLIKNEKTVKRKLENFINIKNQFNSKSKNALNSKEDILYKYFKIYKNINNKFLYLFSVKKYLSLFNLFCRIKDDFFVLKNFKLSNSQKKKIFEIYVMQNLKLSKYIKLNNKYLRLNID